MRFLRMAFSIVFCVVISLNSYARIGETYEECCKRYGEVTRVDEKSAFVIFQRGGLYIAVSFYKGRVGSIVYEKKKRDVLDIPEELKEEEIDVLLKANAGRKEFKEIERFIFATKYWETEDGILRAQYEELMTHRLWIYTKEWQERYEAKRKADAKKKLEEF